MKIKANAIENETARQAKTLKEVAALAGITECTLKAARNGEEIQIRTAGRIAAALGLQIEKLIERG